MAGKKQLVKKQSVKKEESSTPLIALLKAAKNFDRISTNYYALQESQRYVEQHNYESAKEKLEFAVFALIDSRTRTIISDLTGKKLADTIKETLADTLTETIEEKVLEVIEGDSFLSKLRRSMALKVNDDDTELNMEDILNGNQPK